MAISGKIFSKIQKKNLIFLEGGSEENEWFIHLINSIQLKGNVLASYCSKGILTAQAVSPTLGPRSRAAGRASSIWLHFFGMKGEKNIENCDKN